MRTCNALLFATAIAASSLSADPLDTSAVIQAAPLDSGRPYFIPTHPRVTTTVRFPGEINAPDGAVSVFTEDATKQAGEYLVSWQPGDTYLTLTPLKDAQMANLNVPFQGQTYVFYFYPVADPLKAVASVNLVSSSARPGTNIKASPADLDGASEPAAIAPAAIDVMRQTAPPSDHRVPATAARLLGFIDRLKLIHAGLTKPGMDRFARSLNLQIAVSRELGLGEKKSPEALTNSGLVGEIPSAASDSGLFQIVLLCAVRDPRLNCLGFICLVRNTSNQVLAFDVNSFGARAGSEYLGQRISDAVPILNPKELAPAYFVVQPGPNDPLLPTNDWKISVDLVSPRVNPGAAITRGFDAAEKKP